MSSTKSTTLPVENGENVCSNMEHGTFPKLLAKERQRASQCVYPTVTCAKGILVHTLLTLVVRASSHCHHLCTQRKQLRGICRVCPSADIQRCWGRVSLWERFGVRMEREICFLLISLVLFEISLKPHNVY